MPENKALLKAVDDKLKELAEDYVINHYYRAGNRSYAWVEESDYTSDDMEVETGECPPSDADDYSWWEIISSGFHSSEIEDRDDETGEYCVKVEAWIAVSSGNQDEEVDENVAPDLRTIYVLIDRDEAGDYYVDGVEE